jgi:hypothetical protein
MERRVAEALQTLQEMVGVQSADAIEETEMQEYEERVAGLAKSWWHLSRRTWLPSPREIARYGWSISHEGGAHLKCSTCHVKVLIDGDSLAPDERQSGGELKELMRFDDLAFDHRLKQTGLLKYSHKALCTFALVEVPLQYEYVYAAPSLVSSEKARAGSPPAVYCFLRYVSLFREHTDFPLPLIAPQTRSFLVSLSSVGGWWVLISK